MKKLKYLNAIKKLIKEGGINYVARFKQHLKNLETEYKKVEELKKEEKNMLKKGFKYKLKIYIHHYSGGDDTAEVTYHKTKPTKAYIKKKKT